MKFIVFIFGIHCMNVGFGNHTNMPPQPHYPLQQAYSGSSYN